MIKQMGELSLEEGRIELFLFFSDIYGVKRAELDIENGDDSAFVYLSLDNLKTLKRIVDKAILEYPK